MTALRDAFAKAYTDSRVVVGDLFGSVVSGLGTFAGGVASGMATGRISFARSAFRFRAGPAVTICQ